MAKDISTSLHAGIYCRDCACNLKSFDPKNRRLTKDLNTEAAEQIWSLTNRLANTVNHLSRSKGRLFNKSYCIWLNKYEGLCLQEPSSCDLVWSAMLVRWLCGMVDARDSHERYVDR